MPPAVKPPLPQAQRSPVAGMSGVPAPGVARPAVPGVQRPQAPGVARPAAPGVQKPQAPGVARPAAPGVQKPHVPGVAPRAVPQGPPASHAHPASAPHARHAAVHAHDAAEAPRAKGLLKLLGHGDAKVATKRLYVYGGAAAAVIVVLAIVIMAVGGKEPAHTVAKGPGADSASPAIPTQEAVQADRLKKAEAELKSVEAEEAANPRAYKYLEGLYYNLSLVSRGLPDEFQARVRRKLDAILAMHKEEGKTMIEFVDAQVAELAADEDRGYREALRILAKLPPEIEGIPEYEERFQRLRETAATYAQDERYLVELKREAEAFARKKLYTVAERIIREGFNEREFATDTPIWDRREEILKKYEAAPMREAQERMESEELARKTKEREEREKAFAQRHQEFTAGKEKVSPEPLLGQYDLINWPFRSRNAQWKLTKSDGGAGCITAVVPDEGHHWVLGPNGSHWEDYVLRFKAKISKGTLILFPRVTVAQINAAAAADPAAGEGRIAFDADQAGDGWITVTIEVVGAGDSTRVEVAVEGGNKAGTTARTGADLKLAQAGDAEFPDRGAFLFVFCKGSEISIQDVDLRLVRHSRRGILD